MPCEIHLKRVTSTQDFAEAIAPMLEGEFVVIADEQTKARGRMGRSWFSPRGGIWVTYVKRGFPVDQVPYSTLKVSLAIADVLGDINPKIRWPNDVVVNDKKIAGILVEASIQGNSERGDLFIGFGIDTEVKEFPPGIRATSYFIETGRQFQRNVGEILEKVNQWLRMDNKDAINQINNKLSIKNRKVKLITKEGEMNCEAMFVDYMGRLVTDCGVFEVQDVERVDLSD